MSAETTANLLVLLIILVLFVGGLYGGYIWWKGDAARAAKKKKIYMKAEMARGLQDAQLQEEAEAEFRRERGL